MSKDGFIRRRFFIWNSGTQEENFQDIPEFVSSKFLLPFASAPKVRTPKSKVESEFFAVRFPSLASCPNRSASVFLCGFMNYKISQRAASLAPSLTLAIDSKAKQMKAEGL